MLLSSPTDAAHDWPAGVQIAVDGPTAFAQLLDALAAAQRRIVVRAYIWRDDATGQRVAEALLSAAQRGVRVEISKDLDGAVHELHEAAGQSLWHKRQGLGAHVRSTALYGFYGPRPKIARQRPSVLAERLRAHPQVNLHTAPLYDHAKVIEIDDELLLLGGMCLGDDAHHELLDYLVILRGGAYVAQYRTRLGGRPPGAGPVRFALNGRPEPEGQLRAQRLELLRAAQRSVRIEMAFFGDPALTEAIIEAVQRGVAVQLLTSARAGKLRWYNPHLLERIRRRTGNPEHLYLGLHPRVVHAKLMVVDERVIDLGSANFTRLSHEGYREAQLFIESESLASALCAVMDQHSREARRAQQRIRASRIKAGLEAHFMARAGRAASRQRAREAE